MGLWSVSSTRVLPKKADLVNREVCGSDVDLMLRVRDDDERAFASLYARYHRRVQDFFYGLSGDAHTAADLCQETFFRIWRVRGRYAATGSFPSYLFTFARNIWLEHCRGLRKIRRLGYADSIETHWDTLRSLSVEPDAAAQREELRAHVFAALDDLPHEQRMVFILRNIDGLGLEEIAHVMQCPVNTVRSRKLLAQKKIRETLRERMVTPSHAL